MIKERKRKVFIICILMIGIASLSIGFAAFSATLNISSSASVTPDSSSFSVRFSGSEDDPNETNIYSYNNEAPVAKVSGNTITGIDLTFYGSGYQEFCYDFYVHNSGQYPAFLKSINLGDGMTCKAVGDATNTLVQAACNDIFVNIYNESFDIWGYRSGKFEFGGHRLDVGDSESMFMCFSYMGNALADGEFEVEFDDVVFDYSSADFDEVTFTLLGKVYSASKNMTFYDWIYSDYNVDGFYLSAHEEIFSSSGVCVDAHEYDNIQQSDVYTEGDFCI